jgi:hypothetical protein
MHLWDTLESWPELNTKVIARWSSCGSICSLQRCTTVHYRIWWRSPRSRRMPKTASQGPTVGSHGSESGASGSCDLVQWSHCSGDAKCRLQRGEHLLDHLDRRGRNWSSVCNQRLRICKLLERHIADPRRLQQSPFKYRYLLMRMILTEGLFSGIFSCSGVHRAQW